MSGSKMTSEGRKGTKKPAAAAVTTKSATSSSVATAKPAPTTSATAKATAAKPEIKKRADKPKVMISSEERHRMISEAAYFIAEKRGFQGGSSEQDWLAAADQIDRMIMSMNKTSGA